MRAWGQVLFLDNDDWGHCVYCVIAFIGFFEFIAFIALKSDARFEDSLGKKTPFGFHKATDHLRDFLYFVQPCETAGYSIFEE